MLEWYRPPAFQITRTRTDRLLSVQISGNASSDLAHLWQDEFMMLITERPRRLVLDLSELRSISNLFLTALERLIDYQHRHGGEIKLLRPRPVVREMLELCELSHLIEQEDPAAGDVSGFVRVKRGAP